MLSSALGGPLDRVKDRLNRLVLDQNYNRQKTRTHFERSELMYSGINDSLAVHSEKLSGSDGLEEEMLLRDEIDNCITMIKSSQMQAEGLMRSMKVAMSIIIECLRKIDKLREESAQTRKKQPQNPETD